MSEVNPHPDALALTFESHSSCEIADSVHAVCGNGKTVANLQRRSAGAETSVSGPAYTVEYAPQSDPRPALDHHYMDTAPKDSVVVIGVSPDYQLETAPYTKLNYALYGGLMSTRASYIGCNGTVVLGNVRDLSEHGKLHYPVFSFGTAVHAASAYAKVVAVNGPLYLHGEVLLNGGDWVVCDDNGMAVVPKNLAMDVAQDAKHRTHADSLAAHDIGQGELAGVAIKARRSQIPKLDT